MRSVRIELGGLGATTGGGCVMSDRCVCWSYGVRRRQGVRCTSTSRDVVRRAGHFSGGALEG